MRLFHIALFLPCLALVACDGEGDTDKPADTDTGGSIDTDSGDTDSGGPVDADGDGYPEGDDCDDDDATIHPGADELCDGLDQDCDGDYDEDAIDRVVSYTDADGDGYGADGTDTLECPGATGYATVAGDCNDATATVNPGADEYCNGVDDDCDGDIDEESVDGTWYADNDNDGWGSNTDVIYDCTQPAGTLPTSGDCDDASALVYPGADEYCDNADNDCDGEIDNHPVDGTPWYLDADGDGAGDPATAESFCSDPGDRVANGDDCDDADMSVYPGAPEVCEDGIDNGCDGTDDCAPHGFLIPGDAELKLLGLSEKEFAGSAFWLGDVDGDGNIDILTGAYGYNPGSASQAGLIYLNTGPFTGAESLTAPDATIVGETQGDALGWAISAADFDGDGNIDVVTGASGYDVESAGSEGAAMIFAGPITGDLTASDAVMLVEGDGDGDGTGTTVVALEAGSADLFVVGAPYNGEGGDNAGAVGVFAYASGSVGFLADATALFIGDGDDAEAGASLASGDVDGDGIGDLLIGAPGTAGQGAVCLVYGPLSGTLTLDAADAVILGEAAWDGLGASVAVGDLDLDGLDDLFMGADYNDTGATDAGAAYVFTTAPSGTGSASAADIRVYGAYDSDYAGRSVGLAGDVDADGYNEFLVGATAYDASGGVGAGAAFLIYGPASGSISLATPDAVLQGANAYDAMGHRVGGADLDGDGFSDVVSTAMGRDDNGTSSGGLFSWFGSRE